MDKQISNKIKQAMEEKGLTYRALENKTGISRSTLQRYIEKEDSKVSLDSIEKIAMALHIEPSYLIGYDALSMKKCSISPINEKGTRDCILLSEEEKSVILAYRAQPEMRKAVFRILKIKHSEQI